MEVNWIFSKIQNILNKTFSETEKRRIVIHPERLNCACPYCGDSQKVKSKKRGNLYTIDMMYVCFNCDKKTSFDKLCKDFDEEIELDKKLELIKHYEANFTYEKYEDTLISTQLDKLLNLNDIVTLFNSDNSALTQFKPVTPESLVDLKLTERKITGNLQKNIYEGYLNIGNGRTDRVMCFLNRCGDKVLGIQIRNLKEGKNRDFKIYNYETLHKWLNNSDVELSDLAIYNKLSYFYNILNVDFEKKITIFEGYLDSLFFPNSVGCVGVNTDLKFFEQNNLNIQYFFDNDEAGHLKTEEKIKAGFSCFLWNKLFQDIVEKKKVDDPYSLLYRISKVKDLNKLAELVNDPFKTLNLSNYLVKMYMI